MIYRVNRKLLWILIAGSVGVAATGAYWLAGRATPPHYVTTAASVGDVINTITASGSVNPVVVVSVGTYVSGTIVTLSCDYNTQVHKGQLCAKIDPRPYQVIADQDQADLDVARAQLVKDRANVVYTKVNHERMALLLTQDSISKDAVDVALNAYRQAVAQVGLDVAQIAQRAAALRAARINLDYTNIISPVDGTVVSRNVTAGQTVAASFQTPTLFLIATDLTKMQVDTNVSESDIAGAVEGATASFTVDAFPRLRFQGRVTQVRQAPVSVQNVITYDVVITVDNPGLLLKPGMTATARIIAAQARNVLKVPSQALRFTPAAGASGTVAQSGPSAPPEQQIVWVLRAGRLIRVPVTVGLVGDSFTEVKSGSLRSEDQVVTSEVAAGATQTPSTSRLRL
jgi:HlyD family secretion protein